MAGQRRPVGRAGPPQALTAKRGPVARCFVGRRPSSASTGRGHDKGSAGSQQENRHQCPQQRCRLRGRATLGGRHALYVAVYQVPGMPGNICLDPPPQWYLRRHVGFPAAVLRWVW